MIQQLDNNCGEFFSVWKNYVYFQSGNGGLYRVKHEGGSKATQLDPNCRNLVVADDDYVYFQAGNKGLYKVPVQARSTQRNCTKYAGTIWLSGKTTSTFRETMAHFTGSDVTARTRNSCLRAPVVW